MIDFDKLFHDFLEQWYEKNLPLYEDLDELEEREDDVYEEWCTTPAEDLGGLSPRQYFEKITDAKDLMDMFFQYYNEGYELPAPLLDQISQTPSCEPYLMSILQNAKVDDLTMYSVNILSEMGSSAPFDLYIKWVMDDKMEKELRDVAGEVLSENYEKVAEKLLKLIPYASPSAEEYLCDVLVKVKGNDDIYNLLKKKFLSGDNYQLYAAYLGQYENEEAIPILKEVAKICDYLSFIEIRNSIERLGGECDIERDFSNDPYFKKIKSLKEKDN